RGIIFESRLPLKARAHHLLLLAPLRDRDDVARDRLHHATVLLGVAVTIVHAGDPALAVVGDAVQRLAPEPERGDPGREGAAQVVRRHLLVRADLLADGAHGGGEGGDGAPARAGEHEAGRWFAFVQFLNDCAHRRGQPDAVRLAVLGAGPT